MNTFETDLPRRFYGKYAGTVVDNVDEKQIGRVKVKVPNVFGENASSWAMPCVPAAGLQAGLFIVPPFDSKVWIEFEQGDPDHPIWSGGFWGSTSELPPAATTPPAISPGQNIVLQTTGRNSITLSDSAGETSGIVLKSASGLAMIVVNDSGIHISNGQGASITLMGNTVAVNGTSLTVVG